MPAALHHMFLHDIAFSYHVEGDVAIGELEVDEELRIPGTRMVRPSILGTVADVVAGGVANRLSMPRIPLTVDLTVHSFGGVTVDVLTMVGRALKAGRSTILTEVTFFERGAERPVALSHATFLPSPNAADEMEFVGSQEPRPSRLSGSFSEQMGIRVVRPGLTELDRVEYVMQPTGTIQGGAIAMMAEVAAETLTGAPVLDLDVRFASAIRVGPGRASAELVAPGLVRVEVHDPGNGDRLATVALAKSAG
jgi:acyl-coenzyme A thioesterase PaaI-like protein